MTEISSATSDFPVVWQRADDAKMFWQLERLHFPDPMTPMDFAFMADAHDQLNWALERYGLPIRYHYRLINHRWYNSIAPLDLPSEQLHAMGERGEFKIQYYRTAPASRVRRAA